MKTYPIYASDKSTLFAFEIPNTFVRLSSIARTLASVDGVKNIERRKWFSISADVPIKFQYQGIEYIVWEPFGDNSRYWIGPRHTDGSVKDIRVVEAAFKER
jgi:hypothetical protein